MELSIFLTVCLAASNLAHAVPLKGKDELVEDAGVISEEDHEKLHDEIHEQHDNSPNAGKLEPPSNDDNEKAGGDGVLTSPAQPNSDKSDDDEEEPPLSPDDKEGLPAPRDSDRGPLSSAGYIIIIPKQEEGSSSASDHGEEPLSTPGVEDGDGELEESPSPPDGSDYDAKFDSNEEDRHPNPNKEGGGDNEEGVGGVEEAVVGGIMDSGLSEEEKMDVMVHADEEMEREGKEEMSEKLVLDAVEKAELSEEEKKDVIGHVEEHVNKS